MDAGGGNNAVRQAMTCVGGKEYPASGALVACERVQGLQHGGCNSACLRQQAACLLARSQLAAAAALVGGGGCLAANSAPLGCDPSRLDGKVSREFGDGGGAVRAWPGGGFMGRTGT